MPTSSSRPVGTSAGSKRRQRQRLTFIRPISGELEVARERLANERGHVRRAVVLRGLEREQEPLGEPSTDALMQYFYGTGTMSEVEWFVIL